MSASGFNFSTTYTSLPQQFFAGASPQPAPDPTITILNQDLAASMGLDFSGLSATEQANLFSGNQLPDGATPFAQAYAGHQFGQFTMLGDGRALLWGEHVTPTGDRFDIQIKGSGRTPFSRGGDGRAALGPMLREYVISEAMYHLGIPTTRSLAVASTGESVMRERALPGAVLTRVASSHIRFGTFQFAAAQNDPDATKALLDYTIQRHYPDLKEEENKALALIKAVMERQIDLVVHWMRVGFIHGVMNTDNMTLSGEAIDFGPCAFMDGYDPNTVFSSIDQMGRYAYGNQPKITQWNLARLAETLLPLMDDDMEKAIKRAEHLLKLFPEMYQKKWLSMMRAKLGLFGTQAGDDQLIVTLLKWMHQHQADYTNVFLDLSGPNKPDGAPYDDKAFDNWSNDWQARLAQNAEPREASIDLMRRSNPAVIPRNHKVEQALAAANTGDLAPFHDLLAALKAPYRDRDLLRPYQQPPKPDERVYQTFCGT